ncbi:MAG: PqqD family protein [Planctomycetota bacterium]
MSRRTRKRRQASRATQKTAYPAEQLLEAVAYQNQAMEVRPLRGGGCRVEVPLNRPRWLIPPLSWVLPFSSRRRVELDVPGREVMGLCDGRRTVEEIIEKFASNHKLTFREAQLSVTTFIKQLTQRGLVVIVGEQKETERE